MTLSLRPYQIAHEAAVLRAWERDPAKGAMVVSCVGSGKTEVGLWIVVHHFLELGKRVLWLAHRTELVTQPYDRLLRYWFKHGCRAGVVQANRNACDQRCVFASIDTLAEPGRTEQLLRHGDFDLVVYDECHHATSPQNSRVLASVRAPHTLLLMLTATPGDDPELFRVAGVASFYGILDGQRDGWLVEAYAAVARAPRIDELQEGDRLDVLPTRSEAELLEHVVKHTVDAMTREHVAYRLPRPTQDDGDDGQRFVQRREADRTARLSARGRTSLVFCANARQAKATAEALAKAGFRADWAWYNSPTSQRRRVIKGLNTGALDVVAQCVMFGEGTDIPRVDCVVMARRAASTFVFQQGLGRGVRLFDPGWDHKAWGLCSRLDARYRGKRECFVIDLSGCTEEHSLVTPPALLGINVCDHAWSGRPGGRAVCERPGCDAILPCFASLQAGGNGQHGWPDPKAEASGRARPVCRYCGRERCTSPLSPDGRHAWGDPDAHFRRKCQHPGCKAAVTLPLASLVNGRRPPHDDTALLRLPDIEPETWAVDLEEHGVLLLTGERGMPGRWRPILVRDGVRPPEPLAREPVGEQEAWQLARSIAKTARKAKDAVWGRELYGGHETVDLKEEARRRAIELALQAGVARMARSA